MKKIPLFGMAAAISISSVATLFAQTPDTIPGLQLWLDAQDGSTITEVLGVVSQWDDKSGNNFHATQTDPARQPTNTGTINGNTGIHLDTTGVADGLAIDAGLNLGRPYTAYIVDQYWGANFGRTLQGETNNWLLGKWGFSPNPGGNAHYTGAWVGPAGGVPAGTNAPAASEGLGTPNYSQFNIDGRNVGGNAALTAPGNLQISYAGTGTFNEPSQSDVGEVVIFNRALADNERNAMAQYLGNQWGLTTYQNHNATRTSLFTGADAGEGLDFQGTFVAAVNARGAGGFSIGDAAFTDDSGVITSENEILSWTGSPTGFGGSGDDTNLNTLMQSIRWTNTDGVGLETIDISVGGLSVGTTYKLQLIFGDAIAGNNRHFAVDINGDRVIGDFAQDAHVGDSTTNDIGVAVVHEFVATSTTLTVALAGTAVTTPGNDRNPLIQGLTVEDLGFNGFASTGTFANAGELDFSGTFAYALDINGPGGSVVGDASFTADTSTSGVLVGAENQIPNWTVPDYGATSDDDALEVVMQGIRWTATDTEEEVLSFDLDVTPGQSYKLQLLFDDNGTTRGADVMIDGILVKDDFAMGDGSALVGNHLTYIFTAPDSRLNIVLDGFSGGFTDRNPILNALTLEEIEGDGDDDNDGLPDQWELDNFEDLDEVAGGDPDGDNLTNAEEFALGTDPDEADIDGDTLNDDVEVALGTDPYDDDSDDDNLTDGDEVNVHGTDPNNADPDLDYLMDDLEIAAGSDPFILDTDGDGYSDFVEVTVGSSPIDASSTPAPGTYVGNFTGGDIGDGLDLDGDFLYAVNVGTNGAPGLIRDADFTVDTVTGVTVTAQHEIPAWNPAVSMGDTANDNALEAALASIRYSGGVEVTVDLSGLTTGTNYKLQLLFDEACCPNRGFDVLFDGNQIVDDFRPGVIQNDPRPQTGAVVTHSFLATAETVSIVLSVANIADPGITDFNPILNAFTLETLPPGGDFEIVAISRAVDSVTIEYNGVNGKVYRVDHKPTLDTPFWAEVDDNVMSTGEGSEWVDTDLLNERLHLPDGYYRVRDPVLMPDAN